MSTRPRTRPSMTLEEFFRWDLVDEKPYLEYFGGRIEVKVSPQKKHNVITKRLTQALDDFAGPSKLGEAFPELRCTFAGRSIVPDVVFLLDANIQSDDRGELVDETLVPPDIQVEIWSPDQTVKKTREKLEHSVANGCPLGWYIDPYRRTVDIYRPGLPVERLPADGFLDASPVLPGFRLAVSEVFGWLIYRTPRADGPGAENR